MLDQILASVNKHPGAFHCLVMRPRRGITKLIDGTDSLEGQRRLISETTAQCSRCKSKFRLNCSRVFRWSYAVLVELNI